MDRDSGGRDQMGLWEQVSAGARSSRGEPRVWSVSELVHRAAEFLENEFGKVWVEGEISNLKVMGSGHHYFTIKDNDAQLAAALFRGQAGRLKHQLADGQAVRVRGRVTVYPAQGRFQIIVDRVEPAGIGALLAAQQRLKAKLTAEGLFDEKRKRPLPEYPRTIGVVTSPTGAAIRDILDVLGRRWPARVVLSPTSVQGMSAPTEIVMALARVQNVEGLDLVICGRGGGSVEDLSPFSDERVVRAISDCRVPVISAVGHEVDFTLSDLAADLRAPTPSAAAELAVPDVESVRAHIASCARAAEQSLAVRLERLAAVVHRLRTRFPDPQRKIQWLGQDLDARFQRLNELVRGRLKEASAELVSVSDKLRVLHPRTRLSLKRKRFESLRRKMAKAGGAIVPAKKQRLAVAAGRLQALSPLAVLERGYGLVLDQQGQSVRTYDQVDRGDRVDVLLHRGSLRCSVESRSAKRRDYDPDTGDAKT